ncbi:MAG: amino acid adenylation domain-containing protein [bacterium]|nr:amino acid adenylation domain-containing protein [bacterium]
MAKQTADLEIAPLTSPPGFPASAAPENGERPVFFLFPGQGAQYAGMGRELYDREATFRAELDLCSELVSPRLGCDLRSVLFPAAGREQEAARRLAETRLSQPTLFAVEYALARLWITSGVRPQAMIGHSLGEYVAACLAGVFSLEEGLTLVAERGRLMQATTAGAMLSVSLPEEELAPLVGEGLSLAAFNASSLCTVSGTPEAVAALNERLETNGVECRPLRITVAAHSPRMDPVIASFVREVSKVPLKAPQIPFISNVTGRWIGDQEATDPAYWGRQLRQPVRFAAGLGRLLERPDAALLEVGPGRTLVSLAGRHPDAADRLVLASMRHPKDYASDVAFLANTADQLRQAGVAVERVGFSTERSLGGERASSYSPPRTPLEELLAGIWEQVFQGAKPARPVGIHDDFFDLGGDSLAATRVLSRVRRELEVELSQETLFERPTVAGLAEHVAAAQRRKQDDEVVPLRPVARYARAAVPLSFAQQRLWFLDRLEPDSALYNIPIVLHLTGRLDRVALAQALNEVVRRHEVLRTTFDTVDDVPLQVVRSALRLPLPVVELAGLSETHRRTEAHRRALAQAQAPFDLSRNPPLRTTLLELAQEEHLLLLTMHHIASDRWSVDVFLRELALLYRGLSTGRSGPGHPELPELPIQYADFAVWQREWSDEMLEPHLAYWREQLAELSALELPTDRPRPAVQNSRGDAEGVLLPAGLSQRLRALGRERGATGFMTLLAAFQALLGRYSGQQDIVLGSPIANRNRAEIEPLVGFFVNTLVLRGDLRGDPTFTELLARVRDVALRAYAHQDLPFERLVEELEPERSLARNPLVQVLFVLQTTPMTTRELGPGLDLELAYVDTGTAKLDLSLVLEDESALRGEVEYSTDLFDATTIRRMVGHLQNLLAAVAAYPERRISELPLLPAAERRQLLVEWNDGGGVVGRDARYPVALAVHELFEAQVEATPEAVAVVRAGERLSYGELNRRANRLAHTLRALGAGRNAGAPEVLVGLCLEPSGDLIVALVGILKSGAAFVPLDPSFPADRLAFMIEDTGISMLVTRERLRNALPEHAAITVCVEGVEWLAGSSDANPVRGAELRNLAYIIYTSGSTGRPKGVAIPHGALAGHCRSIRRELGLHAGDRVLQSASFNFDVALEQTLPALLSGAQLTLSGGDLQLPSELRERLCELAITVADLPAGYWQQWVGESCADAKPDPLGHLRLVSVGGDVMPAEAACRWHRTAMAPVRLLNAYGPTEATITATVFAVPASSPELVCRHRVPIGRPLAGRALYLLDRRGMPVPIGVPGELHVGGALLARGYLGRPVLTAERFVPDPWSAGGRLYRTGDLARSRPDGNVEYLGRIDDQIKLRGFRIELGEVEAALAACPGVRECAVVAGDRCRAPGDLRLAAYLVSGREEAPAVRDLRAFLEQRLPAYMLPAAFVAVDALPRLASGKVDRAALGRRALPEGSAEEGWVAPRNPREELLAGIWAEVLRRGRVGVHDNFFALGGHSLLATKVLSRARRELGVTLPLRAIFERPTVAALAEHVATAPRPDQGPEAPPLRPLPRYGYPPLSFAQQRLWFLDQLKPELALYNIPATLHLAGSLDRDALVRALDEIVRRHEVLRTSFEGVDGVPVQVIQPVLHLPLPVVDLDRLSGPQRRDEARCLASREAQEPFDLTLGPLLRVGLLRLDPEEHVLLLTVHHIAFDGWSVGVFLHELAVLYQAFSAGTASPDPCCGLPEPGIQYADFAQWQRQWLTGEVLESQLSYWREQLAELPVLELPLDRPRPPKQSFRGARLRLEFDDALSRRLKGLAREQGVTLFMLLQAGFAALLSRYTGSRDIVVGTPIANRNREEIEGLIGFFVNTLVLRLDLAGNPRFRELMHQVREVILEAHDHQDLPFEKLVEALNPERDLSRHPLFQVLFTLESAPPEGIELADLTLRSMSTDQRTAKFDLSLVLEQNGALTGWFEYSTDLFDEVTIARMSSHLESCLEAVAAGAERPLLQLPLLRPGERRQLIEEWNDTASAYPRQASIPELFTAWADETPDATALVCGGEVWSYGELDRRSNQVAHHLRRLGVGAEVPVGLCCEHSAPMVAALVGILKAGGGYLPLDTRYPRERLELMLEDAAAPVLVTEEALRQRFASYGGRVIHLDRDWPTITAESAAHPAGGPRAENLAYVVYTSGSTGKPKGVSVAHRNVVRLVRETNFARLGPQEVFLGLAPVSFDASTLEIWGPLLNGGRLVLYGTRIPSPEDLGRTIEDCGVTALWLTAGLFHQMVEQRLESLAGVRQLLAGGDVLSVPHVRKALAALPKTVLINGYGPTENTTFTSCHPMRAASAVGESVSIGRPIANSRIYVLGRELEELPAGVVGELVTGGDGLARGYLRRPRLTAERFVPDPLSGEPGARLYRTGDQVRYQRSGRLEFLGRFDHQVKIRGFRIELGEVEAALSRHPAIRESLVVVVGGEEAGNKRLVAYLIADRETMPANGELRVYLAESLPDYMVPAFFVWIDAFPLTSHGKMDRRALPAPETGRVQLDVAYEAPGTEMERRIAEVWRQVLKLDEVGIDDNFFDLGGHSLLLIKIHGKLREALECELSIVDLFQYPTIGLLARRLSPESEAKAAAPEHPEPSPEREEEEGFEIAIIGMAGRFPGAGTIEAFWRNLRDGVESISFFSDEELLARGVAAEDLRDPSYVKARGAIDDVDLFDPGFFGFKPREAETMDPQHRLFFECTWEALERAGYDPESYEGLIGVFAGADVNRYQRNLLAAGESPEALDSIELRVGMENDFLASRVSYKLNLKGPAVVVQSACSTSLVAAHMACQSLVWGESDIALAGGVAVYPEERVGYRHHEGENIFPDGHCRAFDANADGMVGGSGVGIVVLKRLADAVADGDHIHAVIKGSAINNDGMVKVGYTAPGVEGQARVIRAARRAAGVEPESIDYVEAHGTGTPLGDPIEVKALEQAFRACDATKTCALGSVKTNIGHLGAASGAASLIKTSLALEHRQIPPSLNFVEPNPAIDFDAGPFYVNTHLAEWRRGAFPRRAGVSSFGIGGTNAHLVLEEAPRREASGASRRWQLVVVSARTDSALEEATDRLATHLRAHPELDLADVAYTLQVGRRGWEKRRLVVARETAEVVAALQGRDPGRVLSGAPTSCGSPVVFMFPGQGAEQVDMVRELYDTEPVVARTIDRCAALLVSHLGLDLKSVLYPEPQWAQATARVLQRSNLAEPALFVVEYALARLWMEWGLYPQALIGEGVGEYVAACLAGVFPLEDALALVATRGRLLMESRSGDADDAGPLMKRFERVRLEAPEIPYLSNLTGTWITTQEATDPSYWGRHLHGPRRLTEGLGELWKSSRVLLEVGPGETLGRLAREHPAWVPERLVFSPLRGAEHQESDTQESDTRCLLTTLGELWLAGVDVDWSELSVEERRHRVPLPTYPFERRRYWIEPPRRQETSPALPTEGPRAEDWLHVPVWKQSPLPPAPAVEVPARWLVLLDKESLGERLAARLEQRGHEVITVSPGKEFRQDGSHEFTLDPHSRRHYDVLLRRLHAQKRLPDRIAHLWSLSLEDRHLTGRICEHHLDRGLVSLLSIEGALEGLKSRVSSAAGIPETLRIEFVSSGMHTIAGQELLCPENASALAALSSMVRDHPQRTWRSIDLLPPPAGSWQETRLVEQLERELAVSPSSPTVAYRGNQRWVQELEPAPEVEEGSAGQLLTERGVYLVMGGLEGLGRIISEYLAATIRARLALLEPPGFPRRGTNGGFPAPREWDVWLANHGEGDATSRKIRIARRLKERGAEVLVLGLDDTSRPEMEEALARIDRSFGEIHGVFYTMPAAVPAGSNHSGQLLRQARALSVLETVLADRGISFCLVESPSTGEPDSAGVTAAGYYTDAFVLQHAASSPDRWVSVSWDRGNREDGSSPEHLADAAELEVRSRASAQALERLLSLVEVPRMRVSAGELERRIRSSSSQRAPQPRAAPEPPEIDSLPDRPQRACAGLGSDVVAASCGVPEELPEVHEGASAARSRGRRRVAAAGSARGRPAAA